MLVIVPKELAYQGHALGFCRSAYQGWSLGFCTNGRPWVFDVPVDLYSCTDKNLAIGKLTRVDLAYFRLL